MKNNTSKPGSAVGRPASPTGRYIKYAIGEILLVMIGILLALQVNNWNEERKKSKQLKAIYERTILELGSDIADLQWKIDFWESKKPLFDSIRIKGFTDQLLEKDAHNVASTIPITTLSTSGVNQLKALQNKDSLTLSIISAYDMIENRTLMLEKEIYQIFLDKIKLLQNYDWYREYELYGLDCKEARAYILNSSEYINNLLWGYNRIYTNYLPGIEMRLPLLKDIRNQLRLEVNPEFQPPTQEALQDYTGTYAIDINKQNDSAETFADTLRITTYQDMLQTDLASFKARFIEDFYSSEDTFICEEDNFEVKMEFERDKQGNVKTLRINAEIYGEKTIYNFKKLNDRINAND
jgi:hypothetical protein